MIYRKILAKFGFGYKINLKVIQKKASFYRFWLTYFEPFIEI
jgi:hypothetical protein